MKFSFRLLGRLQVDGIDTKSCELLRWCSKYDITIFCRSIERMFFFCWFFWFWFFFVLLVFFGFGFFDFSYSVAELRSHLSLEHGSGYSQSWLFGHCSTIADFYVDLLNTKSWEVFVWGVEKSAYWGVYKMMV